MKTAVNQDEVRRLNDIRVLEALMRGPLTRRELQSMTALSWGGITNTVNRLIEAGYIVEKRSQNRGCGRTPAAASLTEEDNFILGIDVNHTGLTGCVTALTGSIISEHAARADFSSPAALMACIEAFIDGILQPLQTRHIMVLGLSMQGEVDIHTGISLRLPQCPGWENMPIRDALSRRFGMDVHIAHDPDCMLHACLAEAPAKDALLMRLDTNVGMAVSINGRMITGCGLMEAGHMVVDPAGPVCSCGRRGCLAAYAARCMQGEYSAIEAPLALAVQGLIQLFRPSRVILAGDMMAHAPRFMAGFMEKYSALGCSAEIVMLSDALSAMRGAALIAADAATDDLDINEETDSGGDEP